MNEAQWSLESLHAFLLAVLDERDRRYGQRFDDLETALRAALAASEKAIGKAEAATERRFEGVNEFRATLSDQASNFITRAEAEGGLMRSAERLQDLTDRVTRIEGRSGGLNAGWGYLLGAAALVSVLVTMYLALRP